MSGIPPPIRPIMTPIRLPKPIIPIHDPHISTNWTKGQFEDPVVQKFGNKKDGSHFKVNTPVDKEGNVEESSFD